MKKIILMVLVAVISCPSHGDDVMPADVENTQAGYAGLVSADETQETIAVPDAGTVSNEPLPTPRTMTPRLSVNTGGLDMNWTGAMDFSDAELRPTQIVLPLLPYYPIDQLEVKFHPLKIQF